MRAEVFEDLFVLELATNHWGSLERGLAIIAAYAEVVKRNNVKAAMKLQFRDIGSFIHKDHRARNDFRYIKKTRDTELSWDQYQVMIDAIHKSGMISMVTPFDEASVAQCERMNVQLLKLASSDLANWPLINCMTATGKPLIASTGGSNLPDIDALARHFNAREIPLAINHCVSIYPSEDADLEINQVDFLRERYPENVIGFSTHEYHDWHSSLLLAYAKGARTFERHVDIDDGKIAVPAYNSLPEQVDVWFKAFHKAREMCGKPGIAKRVPPEKEVRYLDALVRGVYAQRDLPAGHVLQDSDVYFSIPLQKGQISCREFVTGMTLKAPLAKDAAFGLQHCASAVIDEELHRLIAARGLDPLPEEQQVYDKVS